MMLIGPLRDSFGRVLDYLRISLTEDCNFRWVYCVPPEGVRLARPDELLRAEELRRLLEIFVRLGVRRVRLTGGEPLLRKDVLSIVRMLSSFRELTDIALTTNGSMLAPLASSLKKEGLTTVNVSLDSLDRERFRKITGRDRLEEVRAGIREALDATLRVKINVMALSDLSREEVREFCRIATTQPISVRFLEFMPLCGDGWAPNRMLPISTVRKWASEAHLLLPLPRDHHAAETYAIAGAPGTIGFIASLSEPFCDRCNRLRLTASGQLSSCLFSSDRVDLRSCLRGARADEEVAALILHAASEKPRGRESFGVDWNARELPRIRVVGG